MRINFSLLSHWFRIALILLIISNIFFASWYVMRGDLLFQADIARDFLLFREVEQKKFVLIGPRSGAFGVFHGPLWTYINFPIYYLSRGNPVMVGWFWIFLIVMFSLVGFIVAKRIVHKDSAALLSVYFMSYYLIPNARQMSHPLAGFLLMSVFFSTFWGYIHTLRIKYFIWHVLLAGLLIQLEVASGMPFLFLSFLYILFLQIRKHKLRHSFAFFLILIPLFTYIAFDLRHNFFQFKNFIVYIKGNPYEHYVSFSLIVKNRLEYMTSIAMPLIQRFVLLNRFFAILLLVTLVKLLLDKSKNYKFYAIFLYFFFGYFLISLTNRYYLLLQHFMAFLPIVFMVAASLIVSKYKKILLPFLILIIVINGYEISNFLRDSKSFTGSNEASWKFLAKLSRDIFTSWQDEEFGYFVYTPDKLSYAPKYVMVYGQKQFPKKKAYYFTKKPITYVVLAPPPPEDPFMTGEWWKKNSIRITKNPQSVLTYPNGYRVERFELTAEEVAVSFDQHEDTGIHFR